MNTNKTKIVVFRKGGKLKTNEKWTYNGIPIDILSSFKYLGCSVSVRGSFNVCVEELATSACRALFGLKKCISRYPDMGHSSSSMSSVPSFTKAPTKSILIHGIFWKKRVSLNIGQGS